ncbi:MFS transporter [Pseudomonas sp. Leaf127]|uniref:MFS transporter n=1 Tax=Pseudomonas TaxID=286 RepID=UPI000702A87C|nr:MULTISPECIES: MFS transporter [Pseudomonas]KQQ56149.1 MFS transporter [Pseudomonas sp. Leaf127]
MTTHSTPPMRRIVVASVIGNALEWYDFFLYGTAAALVFGPLFFPAGTDPVLGTLGAFAGFAVGFVARPVGGIIFGHVGDRHGRKLALVITLAMMGLATFLMGLLPTYEQAGYLAPLALVLLRLVQGVAAGGEWGGGVLMLSENAPPGKAGFYASFSQLGVSGGFVLSAGAFYLVQLLPQDSFMSWGWRIPFLASVLIFGVGLYIRHRLPESRAFNEQKTSATQHLPVMQVLREHPKAVLQAMGLRLAENGGAYIFLSFSMAYAKFSGLSTQIVLMGVMLAMVLEAFSILFWGWLSDIVGRRAVYAFGSLSLVALAFPFFWLFDTHDPLLVYLALVLGLPVSHGAMIGTQPALMAELFPTHVRYTGLALGHEIASIFAGGFAPLIATALFATVHAVWPVSVMLLLFGTVTSLTLLTMSRHAHASPSKPAPALE